jgi:hypothetical protein
MCKREPLPLAKPAPWKAQPGPEAKCQKQVLGESIRRSFFRQLQGCFRSKLTIAKSDVVHRRAALAVVTLQGYRIRPSPAAKP